MTKDEWENIKLDFKEWYIDNASNMELTRAVYESLLTSLLIDNDGFSNPKIESRIKTRSSCIGKFERRKINDKEVGEVTVEKLRSEITDLIGIRIICAYEDEIPNITKIIENKFEIIKNENKTDRLKKDEKFGYKSVHLDVRLSAERLKLEEYKKVSIFPVEIQIRTIIQHAWSSLDHRIIYKNDVPDEISRAVARLAALFEIADSEFIRIRERVQHQIKSLEENNKKTDSKNRQNENFDKEPEKSLDDETFMVFLEMKNPSYQFYSYKAISMLNEILHIDEHFSLKALVMAYDRFNGIVKKYREENDIMIMNPYTRLRHILYISDKEKYAPLLTKLQQNNFDDFLAKQNTGKQKAPSCGSNGTAT